MSLRQRSVLVELKVIPVCEPRNLQYLRFSLEVLKSAFSLFHFTHAIACQSYCTALSSISHHPRYQLGFTDLELDYFVLQS
jgi:hypothetical protein